MTGYVFRAVWPILDFDRPPSALVAEASGQVDAMAGASRCRLLGEVRWKVCGGFLHGEATAEPLSRQWTSLADKATTIESLAGRGLTDRAIADLLGCSESGVAKVRERRRIPAGSSRRALGNGSTEGAA